MKPDKILYPGTPWWLLLLIPAVFFGFYSANKTVKDSGLANVCNMDHAMGF